MVSLHKEFGGEWGFDVNPLSRRLTTEAEAEDDKPVGLVCEDEELFQGVIGEILIYNSDLSDAEFQQVLNYLEARWGLVGTLRNFYGGFFDIVAALLDELNRTQPVHVVTLEDPIEFVFTDKKSYQFMASQMVGIAESEYVKMMLAGGRSPDGWRSKAERNN